MSSVCAQLFVPVRQNEGKKHLRKCLDIFFSSLCPPHLSLLPTRLCNRLQSRPFSPSSFTITHCPCTGHQMTSQPPEERSSFSRLVLAAGCSCPPAHSRAKTQDICLSEQERDAHRPLCPSVSGSYCPVTSSTAYYSVQNNKVVLVCGCVCLCVCSMCLLVE